MDIMERPVIREAMSGDVSSIVRLSSALFREDGGTRDPNMNINWPIEHGTEHFTGLITGDGSVCFVACIDDQVIGYLAGYVRDRSDIILTESSVLQSIYVEERYRSHGIGSRLVKRFMEWSRTAGAVRVTVTAYASNKEALDFYRRNGFMDWEVTLQLDPDVSS